MPYVGNQSLFQKDFVNIEIQIVAIGGNMDIIFFAMLPDVYCRAAGEQLLVQNQRLLCVVACADIVPFPPNGKAADLVPA